MTLKEHTESTKEPKWGKQGKLYWKSCYRCIIIMSSVVVREKERDSGSEGGLGESQW